jgi:hypothetical protein
MMKNGVGALRTMLDSLTHRCLLIFEGKGQQCQKHCITTHTNVHVHMQLKIGSINNDKDAKSLNSKVTLQKEKIQITRPPGIEGRINIIEAPVCYVYANANGYVIRLMGSCDKCDI